MFVTDAGKSVTGFILVEVIISFCIFSFCMIFFLNMNKSIVNNTTTLKEETLFLVKAKNLSRKIFFDLENQKNFTYCSQEERDSPKISITYDASNAWLGMTLVKVNISQGKFSHTFQRAMDLPFLSKKSMLHVQVL